MSNVNWLELAKSKGLTYEDGRLKGKRVKEALSIPKSRFQKFIDGEFNPVSGKYLHSIANFFGLDENELKEYIIQRKNMLKNKPSISSQPTSQVKEKASKFNL